MHKPITDEDEWTVAGLDRVYKVLTTVEYQLGFPRRGKGAGCYEVGLQWYTVPSRKVTAGTLKTMQRPKLHYHTSPGGD